MIAPKLSVLLPVYNEELKNLKACFKSLQLQTYKDYECFVIDDSSKKSSANECKILCDQDSRFIYIRPKQKLGISHSLNVALGMAKGELIARIDSDDVCEIKRFEKQIKFLEQNKDIDIIGSNISLINSDGKIIGYRKYPSSNFKIKILSNFVTPIAHSTVIYRKETVKNFGGYSDIFKYAEDLELWLRWLNKGVKFSNYPEILVKYRVNNFVRNNEHWKYNLKARKLHFKKEDMIFLRSLGYFMIYIYSKLPTVLQVLIFHCLRSLR